MNHDLAPVRELAARESGLAVLVAHRFDGSAHTSVVNAGVLPHPDSGAPVIGVVIRGHALKLRYLRRDGRASIVFRSDWDWLAVEGVVELIGPDDDQSGEQLPHLLRSVYAAAVGGSPEQWAGLDDQMRQERHTAALLHPSRIYGGGPPRGDRTMS